MAHGAIHELDNPVWSALTGPQSPLSEGTSLARRYRPEIAPFAAVRSDEPAAFAALAQMLGPNGRAMMPTLLPLPAMDGLTCEVLGKVVQMVAPTRPETPSADGVRSLGPDDVPEMLDLAVRTRPGPFLAGTIATGNYIGIRDRGQLVAMAGERMRLPGYTEISAVCVDDSHRGRGIAGRLMQILQGRILLQGQIPFLHVIDSNETAIRLYQHLGFETRQSLYLNRISRS